MQTQSTTPFGRRSLSLAMVANKRAREISRENRVVRKLSSINGGYFAR